VHGSTPPLTGGPAVAQVTALGTVVRPRVTTQVGTRGILMIAGSDGRLVSVRGTVAANDWGRLEAIIDGRGYMIGVGSVANDWQ
ncbi:hypothetical protein Tco_0615623, partial [Tanacetum coccineum]